MLDLLLDQRADYYRDRVYSAQLTVNTLTHIHSLIFVMYVWFEPPEQRWPSDISRDLFTSCR